VNALAPSSWLQAREDRADLMLWLAETAPALHSTFLESMLAAFLATGRLSEAQEQAIRRAMARAEIEAERDRWPGANRSRGKAAGG